MLKMHRYFSEKTPVGGISVKAHFEINLVPLTIGITQAFYKRIMAFCFPEKASSSSADHHLYGSDNDLMSSKDKKKLKAKGLTGSSGGAKPKASFYVESPLNKDDVEEMKVRAQQNKLFVYIKIPEVPICVSYKGEKEKNKILDVANFRLQVMPDQKKLESLMKRVRVAKLLLKNFGHNFQANSVLNALEGRRPSESEAEKSQS